MILGLNFYDDFLNMDNCFADLLAKIRNDDSLFFLIFGLLWRIYDSPRNDEFFLGSSESSAEVFLMRNRGCVATSEEIELVVH